jgi:patatin-like phospholipase/acyl hydrolase
MPGADGKIRVLSIDGGGIRGIIPARLLQYIEEQTGKPISAIFDLIAGTSTGGILALGLTLPDSANPALPQYTAQQMLQFYMVQGPAIFKERFGGALNEAFRSKISPDNLETALKNTFRENTELRSALKPTLITTYDLHGYDYATKTFVGAQPVFFSSQKANTIDGDNFLTWQVARATSAAPTYFPPMKISPIPRPGGSPIDPSYWMDTIDGGMVANNPAMCAWVEAAKLAPANAAGQFSDYVVVSIGTGELKQTYDGDDTEDHGALMWASKLIEIQMDGSSITVDHQLQTLFTNAQAGPAAAATNYYRLQPGLDAAEEDMADASDDHMNDLKTLAETYIAQNGPILQPLCNELKN